MLLVVMAEFVILILVSSLNWYNAIWIKESHLETKAI